MFFLELLSASASECWLQILIEMLAVDLNLFLLMLLVSFKLMKNVVEGVKLSCLVARVTNKKPTDNSWLNPQVHHHCHISIE